MLPSLKIKLRELLLAGLPMYSLRPFSEEEHADLVKIYKDQEDIQAKEKALQKLLMHQIDGRYL